MKTDIIPTTQHGFLPGRSTVTCLLSSLDKWTKEIDRGNSVDVIYFDFQKAFDKVPHRRLIHKLNEAGIGSHLLEWISAFLSDRQFYVRIGDSFSDTYAVKSGVPQGSVLGPVLFAIYISDLSRLLKSNHTFYADDLKIFSDPSSNYDILTDDIKTVLQWCEICLIPVNRQKCAVLHLGGKNPCLPYQIEGEPLREVEKYVDLGVTIQNDLKWSEHISVIVKKANSLIFLLSKCFQTLTKDSFLILYKSHVRPLLEYAAVIWCPYFEKDIALLERTQRRATKMVKSIRDLPYSQRLQELSLNSLSERRLRNDIVWTFKILKGYLKIDLSTLFYISCEDRLRGHRLKLKHEKYKSRSREHFLNNRVFDAWNALPANIIDSESVNIFKSKLLLV
ncbi:hypothetical protein Zmor_010762 [Zophobas morio]|uniref:Reverse transcriptase domain-containing protein n=1 Tax=Zophobas morio TaxID=2755281 RepID=A0AA38IJH7_9CUCU|nr:hypothetical protein Zmor_010762 [Zophobas morio]